MNNKKVCSFFVSEFHLLTILLPYINEKILAEKEIIIISQNDMRGDVKKYLKEVKSLNLENEKILKLSWKKSDVENVKINTEINEIIVIGDSKYVDEINQNINIKPIFDEIVNCYKIENIEGIENILLNYTAILNTEGKRLIEKNSQNAQKRKTIKSQI